MSKLSVKQVLLPTRCEVCHQADRFDPRTGVCLRCREVMKEAADVVSLRTVPKDPSLNAVGLFLAVPLTGFFIFLAVGLLRRGLWPSGSDWLVLTMWLTYTAAAWVQWWEFRKSKPAEAPTVLVYAIGMTVAAPLCLAAFGFAWWVVLGVLLGVGLHWGTWWIVRKRALREIKTSAKAPETPNHPEST